GCLQFSSSKPVSDTSFLDPKHLFAEFEILQQRLRRAGVRDVTSIKNVGEIGEREHEVEIMLDDEDGDLAPQLVERLEDLLDDGRGESLEGLVEEEQLHVAGQRTRDRDHLL